MWQVIIIIIIIIVENAKRDIGSRERRKSRSTCGPRPWALGRSKSSEILGKKDKTAVQVQDEKKQEQKKKKRGSSARKRRRGLPIIVCVCRLKGSLGSNNRKQILSWGKMWINPVAALGQFDQKSREYID